MDMLMARKVKLHGMNDPRWLTEHKISQYKGLISLFRRDKKIVAVDNNVFARIEKNEFAALKKNITKSREDLDNALYGDQQKIRNALGYHRRLQLAFSHLQGEKVAEHIHQENFSKRKQLDLLIHNKREKSKKLVNLKIEVSEMQDRLDYYVPKLLPEEIKTKITTAQVRDAILKKEAAIVIHESYKKILSVMKKDRIYFDAILISLHRDLLKQNRCMLDTIILGQMANEYLDDRSVEFTALEVQVRKDMVVRKKSIAKMLEKVKKLSKGMKYVVRRETVIIRPSMEARTVVRSNQSETTVSSTGTNSCLIEDVEFCLHNLDTLRDSFKVPTHNDLFLCVQVQEFQRERLEELKLKFTESRNMLHEKVDHAKSMYNELLNTMDYATYDYKIEKKQLLKQIRKKERMVQETREKSEKLGNLNLRILTYIQHLEEMCKVVQRPKTHKAAFGYQSKSEEALAAFKEHIDIKDNGLKIIEILSPKLESLAASEVKIKDSERDEAGMCMVELLSNTTLSLDLESRVVDESLIADIEIDDPKVFSRQVIKDKSKDIVKRNTFNDDLIPIYDVLPRKSRYHFTAKLRK